MKRKDKNSENILPYLPGAKPVGKNGWYLALCPFHAEKTPSMFVNGRTELWYCFGCGASGKGTHVFKERLNKRKI